MLKIKKLALQLLLSTRRCKKLAKFARSIINNSRHLQAPGSPVTYLHCVMRQCHATVKSAFSFTGRQLQLMHPRVTQAIALSCTAEPNIGEMLCKELSLVFGRGVQRVHWPVTHGRMRSDCLRVDGTLFAQGQQRRTLAGCCHRRWAERLAAWVCPSYAQAVSRSALRQPPALGCPDRVMGLWYCTGRSC